jgi:hypothetical protein
MTTSKVAEMNSSGLLVRAAWPNNGCNMKRPATSMATTTASPLPDNREQRIPASTTCCLRSQYAKDEDNRDNRQILEQQHRKGCFAN